jgi:hypothetical protein
MLASAVLASAFVLCGERIRFDDRAAPQFTANQIQSSSAAIRGGLEQWAATEHGRAMIERFNAGGYEIVVSEDSTEGGMGRAPEPGIATLTSAGDRSKTKVYVLILNPSFVLPKGMVPILNQPATPADMMAAAWAGEMLHIDFYSRGISLPHHPRDDFQEQWSIMAAELGFPTLKHDDDDESNGRRFRRRPIVRIIGMH